VPTLSTATNPSEEPKFGKQPGAFHLPLHPLDTPTQSFGCRHTNPNVCGRNRLPVCAFTRGDKICLAPPVSWKKLHARLSAPADHAE
jgi:hypothetical protein